MLVLEVIKILDTQTINLFLALGAQAWNVLACSQVILPMGTNGVDDIFPARPWSYEDNSSEPSLDIEFLTTLYRDVQGSLWSPK